MLNDAKVKAAKPRAKPYKLTDSDQLYLLVSVAGGRHWRMNYTFGTNAKGDPAQKTLAFGSYPAVTLLEARGARDKAKAVLRQGNDPAVEKRVAERAQAEANSNTFAVVAEKWFEHNSGWSIGKLKAWIKDHGRWPVTQAHHWTDDPNGRWSNQHAADIIQSLWRDIFPEIGVLPITAIKAPQLLDTLRKVEKRGAIETAHRLRQRMSAVFVYGIAAGICDADPAASLGKALKEVPPAKPQPSIIDNLQDQGARLTALRQLLIDCEAERTRAVTKLALRLIALTAVRPGELAGARWTEFYDLDSKDPHWRIPADRMKGDKERKSEVQGDHIVPLARQSVELIKILRGQTGRYTLLFPSERHVHRQMSENTLRELLIRAGYFQRHVPHGFRAAFSTIMNERPKEQREENDRAVIDLMLAHSPEQKSGSERAYNRAEYMPRRRQLAQEWADMLTEGFWEPDIFIGQPIRYAATGPGRL